MPHVAEAQESDFTQIEEILAENGMLVPAIDGQEAMKRIRRIMGRYFLVATEAGRVVGFIRATYDGSRAIVHQMAVRKQCQREGVGRTLVHEVCRRLHEDGAPTVSVTATDHSQRYYEQFSFKKLPITLMLADDIQTVIETTNWNVRGPLR